MPTRQKNRDDLGAQFQEKTGASKRVVSTRTAVIVVVVILLALAVLAFR